MYRYAEKERWTKLEEAVLKSVGKVGSVVELKTVINSAYGLLGTTFFAGLAISEQPFDRNGPNGHSPEAEIVLTVHELVDFELLRITADGRLKVLKTHR